MLSVLRRPRWIVLTVLVVVIVVSFVNLGLWQLRRLDERRLNNTVLDARVHRPPVTLAEIDASGLPATDLEYTVVALTGDPDPERSVFVRSQTHDGEAGSHQIVPVIRDDGSAVLVNVGWVPLGSFPRDVPGLNGTLTIEGYLRAAELRPRFGQEEADGVLTEIRRIDIERLQQQFAEPLAPYWVQLRSPDAPASLPVAVSAPALDEGTHLAYAMQWFSFAVISVVGYVFLVRREALRGGGRRGRGSYVVDDDAIS